MQRIFENRDKIQCYLFFILKLNMVTSIIENSNMDRVVIYLYLYPFFFDGHKYGYGYKSNLEFLYISKNIHIRKQI